MCVRYDLKSQLLVSYFPGGFRQISKEECLQVRAPLHLHSVPDYCHGEASCLNENLPRVKHYSLLQLDQYLSTGGGENVSFS